MDVYERAAQIARAEIYGGEVDPRSDPETRAQLDAIRDRARFNAFQSRRQTPRIEMGRNDHHAAFVRKTVDEALYRANQLAEHELHPDAEPHAIHGRFWEEVTRMCLGWNGVAIPKRDQPLQLFRAGITQSDLPVILENTFNKSTTLGYLRASETWPLWTRTTGVADFKEFSRPIPPTLTTPQQIGENAEIQGGVLGCRVPGGERAQLVSHAQLINVSREALIDDDLQAIVTTMAAAGRSISRLIGDHVYAVLTGNPAMQDGHNLFDETNHANDFADGGPASVAELDAVRALMAAQLGPNDEQLDLRPRFILGPVGMESTLAAVRSAMNADRDELSTGRISTLTDARLTGTPWYAVTDPQVSEAVQVVVPAGRETNPVRVEPKRTWQDGITFLIGADLAVLPVDHRCIVRNAGA